MGLQAKQIGAAAGPSSKAAAAVNATDEQLIYEAEWQVLQASSVADSPPLSPPHARVMRLYSGTGDIRPSNHLLCSGSRPEAPPTTQVHVHCPQGKCCSVNFASGLHTHGVSCPGLLASASARLHALVAVSPLTSICACPIQRSSTTSRDKGTSLS